MQIQILNYNIKAKNFNYMNTKYWWKRPILKPHFQNSSHLVLVNANNQNSSYEVVDFHLKLGSCKQYVPPMLCCILKLNEQTEQPDRFRQQLSSSCCEEHLWLFILWTRKETGTNPRTWLWWKQECSWYFDIHRGTLKWPFSRQPSTRHLWQHSARSKW